MYSNVYDNYINCQLAEAFSCTISPVYRNSPFWYSEVFVKLVHRKHLPKVDQTRDVVFSCAASSRRVTERMDCLGYSFGSIGVPRWVGGFGGSNPPPYAKFRRPSKIVPNTTRLWKLLKIAEIRTPTPQDVRKKGSKILKLPPVRNCFTLAMTNKLVVIINSLKVPKINKMLLCEMEFPVPNYSCLHNPWLGGYRPQIPVLSVLNWICCTLPHPNKIPWYATVWQLRNRWTDLHDVWQSLDLPTPINALKLWIIKKKVKWYHYRPSVAQRVNRGVALLFHDRGTRRRWVVSPTPRPHFTPPGKTRYPFYRRLGWAPGPVWTGGKSRPRRHSIPDRPARSLNPHWRSPIISSAYGVNLDSRMVGKTLYVVDRSDMPL
jgi:hypothetical protein